METNKKIRTVSLIMILIIIIVSIFAIATMIKLASPEQTVQQIESSSSDIKREAYDKITSPTNYGNPVSANEEGFGRENPFAPFK